MANEWLVYIVANTVDPYGYELPIIVGYPSGLFYRARFKLEWVDEALLADLTALEGLPCVIVYREFESGRLYPIRHAYVHTVRQYGDVVYIEYELADVVPYPKSGPLRTEQLAVFNREWATEHPAWARTNVARGHMRPLVFKSKYWPKIQNQYLPSDAQSREFESWSNLCEQIAEIPLYSSMEFLRIIDLRDGAKSAPVMPRGGRYHFRAGRIYELRVAQQVFRAPEIIQPHDVLFECDGDGVRAVIQRRRAVGKYDVLAFRFRASETDGRQTSGMLAVSGRMKADEPLRLEIIAEIKPRLRILSAVGALLGAIAVLYPEAALSIGVPESWKTVVERVGTVLFVITVLDTRAVWQHVLRR